MLRTQNTVLKPGSPAILITVAPKGKGESAGISFWPSPATKASICRDVMTLGELLLMYSILQQQDLREHNHKAPLGTLPVCSTNDEIQNKQQLAGNFAVVIPPRGFL